MKWTLPWLIPLLGVASASNLRSGRNLQDNPCAADDALKLVNTGHGSWKPSYLASCIRSLEVPKEPMLQHIRNLQTMYRDHDCFYNIANDVEDSNPKEFQEEEFGYSLFTGPEEGQVNLEEELNALIDEVESNGANLGNFYDVQTIFRKPRDAHIYTFNLAGDVADATYTNLFMFPERGLEPEGASNWLSLVLWTPSYDDGKLEILVRFQTAGGFVEDLVDTIDGKTPFDWYMGLISNPAIDSPYQSVGARMNSMFQTLFANAFRVQVPNGLYLSGQSMPPDVMPDSFTVTFVGGAPSETFLVAANIAESVWNATHISEFVNSPPTFNEPGAPYNNYEMALGDIIDARPEDVREIPPTFDSSREQHKERPHPFDEGRTSFVFDGYFQAGQKTVGAYRITDDYAVFKLWDFLFLDECGGELYCIPQFWSTFTQKAREKGVTKAIIDISQNGGGFVLSGSMLAVSMYPFAPYSVWQNTWDSNYNRIMMEYNTTVMPILDQLKAEFTDLTDEELEDKIRHLGLNHGAGDRLLSLFEALITFCGTSDPRPQGICFVLGSLKEAIENLIQFQSGSQLRVVLEGIINTALPEFDPFATIGLQSEIDRNVIRQVTRGGVQQGLTNRYTFLAEEDYNQAAWESFRNGFMFEEYTLVGEGTGGSTTSIFATTLMQLWNNRETWNTRNVDLPPLTTISFGGTNQPKDTTVAGFPASVQQSLNIPYPIIASGLLFSLEYLYPGETAGMISEANEKYKMTLARPPFFLSTLPGTPTVNYYSSFMGEDAMPVQYIKMFGTPNFHIPQIYIGISGREGGDSTQLEELYQEACELPTRPTPAPTPLPTPAPTPAPTILPSYTPSVPPTGSPTEEPDLLPVISVATNTSASAEEIFESWVSFRRNFPDRPFCLLQVRGFDGTDLNVPEDFLFDDKTTYNAVSYDNGDPFRNSDWYNLCGIQESVGLGVRTFPLYIGFDDGLVRSSLEFYEALIEAVSGEVKIARGEGGGNWIDPLSVEFE